MLFKESLDHFNHALWQVWEAGAKKSFALAFSHQIEDTIALDLLLQTSFFQANSEAFECFTLDTKKLFKESLEYQSEVERYFNLRIVSYSAREEDLERIERTIGNFGMQESLQKRKECCNVRKILPLKSALDGKTLWISGIRAAQSVTRSNTTLIQEDAQFNLIKINPLFDWSDGALWKYAKLRNLPQNALYRQGFLSIGCFPCTRAVKEGEDIRAGRWWWENPDHKECGLHRTH